jgi:hypothetical protein
MHMDNTLKGTNVEFNKNTKQKVIKINSGYFWVPPSYIYIYVLCVVSSPEPAQKVLIPSRYSHRTVINEVKDFAGRKRQIVEGYKNWIVSGVPDRSITKKGNL